MIKKIKTNIEQEFKTNQFSFRYNINCTFNIIVI